jgi:hypothetical protein
MCKEAYYKALFYCESYFVPMLRTPNDALAEEQKGDSKPTIVAFPEQQPSLIAIYSAVIAIFALIVFSSISFTSPIWTLNITIVHVVMLFAVAFLLVMGFYLKVYAGRNYQVEPIRKNVALGAQTVTKSIEAIDIAFKSIDAQAALMKDMLTASMLSAGKGDVGAFNTKLQASTEQIKQLFEATKALKESRQILEQRRQQLLNLRNRL